MIVEVLLVLVTLLAFFVWRRTVNERHWQRMGVPSVPKSVFSIGNSPVFSMEVLRQKCNVAEVCIEQYKEYSSTGYYGVYKFGKPELIVTDPDLIKQILVKDFPHFVDRMSDEYAAMLETGTLTDTIWLKEMIHAKGEPWKNMRSAFTPIFTSGKLKGMLPLISKINQELMASLEQDADSNGEFELKDKFGRFTMGTIASCAFGVDSRSFSNEDSQFVQYARRVFRFKLVDIVKFMSAILVPGMPYFFRLFNISVWKKNETMFFYHVITNTLKERRRTGFRRNDLIDLMLDVLKENKGNEDIKEEEDTQFDRDAKLAHKVSPKDIDELNVVATAIVILVAGYDTTGQTLTLAAFELARNPDIQTKLQEEIDELYESIGGKEPDYYDILKLEYLDQVLMETLRRYPTLGVLQRVCTKAYTLPGTNVSLKVNDEVVINVAGLHADPKYYPDPKCFDPTRFSKEERAKRHPYAFLGFGQGPRNCIGMRFAMLEAKLALASIMRRFNFRTCSKSVVGELKLDPNSAFGAPKDDLYVKVERRRHEEST